MTPEGKLKQEVKDFLASVYQCWWFMPVSTGFGKRGVADFIGCWRGKFFAIETKAPGGKETPWQKRFREEVTAAGGIAIVAYSMEDVIALFREA